MHDTLQKFTSDEFGSLEVMIINEKPYFPATECAKVLGYVNPHDALTKHCRYLAKREVPHPQNPSKKIGINYIPEGDLYRLIVRSNLPSAERFEKWVFDEVLPSIRKFGAYITSGTLEEMLQSPEFGIRLLQTIQEERNKNAELQTQIAALAPKAEYYDLILKCKSALQTSIIAKDYGYSATSFNRLLHEIGIQYKMGDTTWLLYQEYAGEGYTKSMTYHVNENKSVVHTYWTTKGRVFLYDTLKMHDIHPLIERPRSEA